MVPLATVIATEPNPFFWVGRNSLAKAEWHFSTLASALHSLQPCSIFAVPLTLLLVLGSGELTLIDGL